MVKSLEGLVRLPGLALRGARVGVVVFCYCMAFAGSALPARVRGGREGRGFADGERWVRMLTRLGPTYIKIGQLLSTRRDLLPDSMTGPMARLNDSSRPPRTHRVERAVWAAYSDRPWPFGSSVRSPSLAGASPPSTRPGPRTAAAWR